MRQLIKWKSSAQLQVLDLDGCRLDLLPDLAGAGSRHLARRAASARYGSTTASIAVQALPGDQGAPTIPSSIGQHLRNSLWMAPTVKMQLPSSATGVVTSSATTMIGNGSRTDSIWKVVISSRFAVSCWAAHITMQSLVNAVPSSCVCYHAPHEVYTCARASACLPLQEPGVL
ncbi:hypothetical protein DL546_001581 [Coniochaeta pulveracea]|uniref:Uncharacterized protein n=1 Tax=Coniochaeta pulveracea TaxID=177199 RepID=A0A420XY94_9PEZI|nr:hypothetical protein DL546_001581 [Coniochaeta pulveracea]